MFKIRKIRYLRKMPHTFKNKLGPLHNHYLSWSRPTLSFPRKKKKKRHMNEKNIGKRKEKDDI